MPKPSQVYLCESSVAFKSVAQSSSGVSWVIHDLTIDLNASSSTSHLERVRAMGLPLPPSPVLFLSILVCNPLPDRPKSKPSRYALEPPLGDFVFRKN